MTITMPGRSGTFDSFECALQAMAPTCAHCGCRVIGHGVEGIGRLFCCGHCAESISGPQSCVNALKALKRYSSTQDPWSESFAIARGVPHVDGGPDDTGAPAASTQTSERGVGALASFFTRRDKGRVAGWGSRDKAARLHSGSFESLPWLNRATCNCRIGSPEVATKSLQGVPLLIDLCFCSNHKPPQHGDWRTPTPPQRAAEGIRRQPRVARTTDGPRTRRAQAQQGTHWLHWLLRFALQSWCRIEFFALKSYRFVYRSHPVYSTE
jgi:hypothetical protein